MAVVNRRLQRTSRHKEAGMNSPGLFQSPPASCKNPSILNEHIKLNRVLLITLEPSLRWKIILGLGRAPATSRTSDDRKWTGDRETDGWTEAKVK